MGFFSKEAFLCFALPLPETAVGSLVKKGFANCLICQSRLIANIYGTAGTQLSETYTYDDYDRQVSWTDTRGTEWQAAYGQKNELVITNPRLPSGFRERGPLRTRCNMATTDTVKLFLKIQTAL